MTPTRPLWLMTLADLALLLLGFMILVHSVGQGPSGKDAIGDGIREAFGGAPAPATEIPLDVNGLAGFAPGDASLPIDPTPLLDWAAEATRDPRSRLVITGEADPTEGLALAARRAAAMADAIQADGRVAADRLRLDTRLSPARRQVTLSVSFGE
ncbi:hypothetical protein GGR88_002273 [Sphingomonas jejuensis]|uniref:Flagellar motor protein MotB n=1 Tax=Sphingomonas jejuensis TaxID=904715 RepID=A0ABX0XND9_9SPHN|nr:flagellar motor protein MotB [Sphingomonas jejuensis]NJC34759.1 hypothetical protein [Sphingomonas jejuensis]